MKTLTIGMILVLGTCASGCEDEGEKLKISLAKQDELTILKVAAPYYQGSKECPTAGQLTLPREFTARGVHDPWGSEFKIICVGNDVKVTCAGPDKKEGTPDDVTTTK